MTEKIENVFEELQWRGLIHSYTKGLPELLATQKVTLYVGFDPTSDSLQVGNLLALLGLARMQRFGHVPIAVAGGGTGLIGDPSGKADERKLLTLEEVEANVAAVKEQMARFLDFETRENPAKIVNNADWLLPLRLVDFLRDIGKHFTVNYMVAKDSVKSRLDRDTGLSYTEFSYMLLQAYDFLHLYQNYGCVLQAGGSDQWGNITAGVDLIRKKVGGTAHGLVYPLVLDAQGNKFGKTAEGAVWLDPERTSPYKFYQFWFRQDDSMVVSYLKYFTWLSRDEIEALAHEVATRPEARHAQRVLAREMTRLVHGEAALARAEQASQVLFGGALEGLNASDIGEIFADTPSNEIPRDWLEGDGILLVDLLAEIGLTYSKAEARRLIKSGGIYVNNLRASDVTQRVTMSDTIEGKYVVLRRGKKEYRLLKVMG